MARIRSIKPEFWTDGSNLEQSDSCALFFVGLWNFCDDEGKHRIDLKQIAAELGGRWHVGKIKLFIGCLIKSGQLRLNSDSTWIQVTGWSHQKIDKPKQPEVKAADLQWLSHDDSTKALDESRTLGARIGSDRIDRIGSDQGRKKNSSANSNSQNLPAQVLPLRPPSASAPPRTNELIGVYCMAWKARYGANPPIGGKAAGQFKTLLKDYGYEKAVLFVESYLDMADQWFLTKRHDIPTLLANLNAVAQFVETGRVLTRKEVANMDRAMTTQNLLDAVDRKEI